MTAPNQLHTRVSSLEQHLVDQDAAVAADRAALAHLQERHEQVERRVDALDTEQFTLTEQLRHVADEAARAVTGLDELERVLAEVQDRNMDTTAAFEKALRQRPEALESDEEAPTEDTNQDDADSGEVQPPTLDQVHSWVAEHISPLVRKITATGEGGGVRWCRQWWLHQDAVDRFVALYWVFTELSEQGTFGWLSVYLRDHLDPHLAILTSPFGPFYACSPKRHSDTGSPLGHAEFDAQTDGVSGTAATARALARGTTNVSAAGTT